MGRRRDWHPPWMTPEEWAEWKAGENDRSRRLYERAKRGHEELEARKRAADEAEQGRAPPETLLPLSLAGSRTIWSRRWHSRAHLRTEDRRSVEARRGVS